MRDKCKCVWKFSIPSFVLDTKFDREASTYLQYTGQCVSIGSIYVIFVQANYIFYFTHIAVHVLSPSIVHFKLIHPSFSTVCMYCTYMAVFLQWPFCEDYICLLTRFNNLRD
jgi:hypothetical protein